MHKHHPDDGNVWPTAGEESTCVDCRRRIVFVVRGGQSYWRASGPWLSQLPKSKRCTSRCPAVGYITCGMRRNHGAACRGGDYVWYRGKGHSRPRLITSPAWAW